MSAPLDALLAAHAGPAATEDLWQVRHYDLREPGGADERALADLLAGPRPPRVRDELAEQLANLLQTRDPEATLDPGELARRAAAHLGQTPAWRYGLWVHYPWSERLVHLLPEAEYRELRTSRNRNKITAEEQERLRAARIGIVGLSIGQAAAATLAMEEVGGEYGLADFDRLDLSNMNRIRTGVHNLGVNKAVLAAREVLEINPFARLRVFVDGLREDNLDQFLTPDGRPLDLLYEECDDLAMKIRVRERAQAHGIPVLMESSDRGMLDIERFDRERGRPVFHGLTGGVKAADLRGLSTFQKVPVVLRILDLAGISERMAASMVDIETTLKSWPQLASEVALGAGINVDVARRILLDQLNASGRFYVDLAELINDQRAATHGQPAAAASFEIGISPEAQRFELPVLRRVSGALGREHVRDLVAYAATAFSGGNCQPWQFVWDAGSQTLRCVHLVERSRSFLDFRHHAAYLAFGAVAETLSLAAGALGLACELRLFPDPADRTQVCWARLTRPAEAPPVDELVRQLERRVTNRQLGPRAPLDPAHRRALDRVAQEAGGRLQWLTSDEELAAIGDVLGRGDLIRLTHRQMHQEMMHELRWSVAEVEQTRDGIDVATLEMTPTDLAGMRLVSNWSVMKMVGGIGGGFGLKRPTKKAVKSASAAVLLTVPGYGDEAYFHGGRALLRVWLAATALDLAFQPMTPITYLFDRLEHGAEDLTPDEVTAFGEYRADYKKLFDLPPETTEAMLFRVATAAPPTARSLRRRVDDILTFT